MVDFYESKGESTISQSPLTLELTTFSAGLFYHLNPSGINPKIGAGVAFVNIKETTPWETFKDDSDIGFLVIAGIEFPLTDLIIVDLFAEYLDVKINILLFGRLFH